VLCSEEKTPDINRKCIKSEKSSEYWCNSQKVFESNSPIYDMDKGCTHIKGHIIVNGDGKQW